MRILDGICYTVREVTAKFVVITRTLQYQSYVSREGKIRLDVRRRLLKDGNNIINIVSRL
jgi:hypothetical protein